MLKAQKSLLAVCLSTALCCNASAIAGEFEITPMFGQMFSSDMQGVSSDNTLSVDNAAHFGLGIAWQESPNGQGQILINRVSHDFTSDFDNQEYDIDITYAHFNGVALFRQQNYITTFSIGLGGALIEGNGEELYLSATAAFGTRYEVSDNFAIVTEIRGYATLVDDEDELFCEDSVCVAHFEDSMFLEAAVSVGIAIKF
ncbi:hypothetical protein [Thalassotalea fusca]